ncbi:MAG TPA: hypothetical protein VJR58_25755 [Vineibacter sp.]|nr:hypothetical protein [Vineibacter sp.]
MADAKLRRVGVGFVCGVPAHPFGGREGDGRLISLLQIRGLAGLVAAIDKEPSMGATIADFTKER